MITKKLIHQIVAFLNNYLNDYVLCGYTYYCKKYIEVKFSIWTIKNNLIDKSVVNYGQFIENEKDFNSFKEKVIKNFNNDLAIAKEQSINSITDEASYLEI